MSHKLLNFWYMALSSPMGIEIICEEVENTRTKLYIERTKAQDEDLKQIALCLSPFDSNRLWMVKRHGSQT